jgi:hypothetical protein
MNRPMSATARALGREIQEATRCTTCGKCRVVLNTSGYRRTFVGETVTVKSHCSCPGGPAEPLLEQIGIPGPDAPLCDFCGQRPAIYAGACRVCC